MKSKNHNKNSKKIFTVLIIVCIALLVFIILLYSASKIENILSYFQEHDKYQNSMVLFYEDNCQPCAKVDTFIKGNNVDSKIAITKLNVINDANNKNILSDRVQACGLPTSYVGVPFLWDGKDKKCVVGYVDIDNFLKSAISVKK